MARVGVSKLPSNDPQSQGSAEHANQDIEAMLSSWLTVNNTSDSVLGSNFGATHEKHTTSQWFL